jgi:hypothetical protein
MIQKDDNQDDEKGMSSQARKIYYINDPTHMLDYPRKQIWT